MSNLQQPIIQLLTGIIDGSSKPELTNEAAYRIAQWATMTAISLEGDDPKSRGVPADERRLFSIDQRVPPNWQIYIGRSEAGPTRGFSHLTVGTDNRIDAQASVIIMGRLIVVCHSNYGICDDYSILMKPMGLYKIFPDFDVNFNSEGSFVNISVDYTHIHRALLQGQLYMLDGSIVSYPPIPRPRGAAS